MVMSVQGKAWNLPLDMDDIMPEHIARLHDRSWSREQDEADVVAHATSRHVPPADALPRRAHTDNGRQLDFQSDDDLLLWIMR
jgi:hypothetical protein